MTNNVTDIKDCKLIELPRVHNPAGNITIIQNGSPRLFDIKRVYYMYDIPGGSERGGHAHTMSYQIIVAASGSFEVILDDCKSRNVFHLNRPYFGLFIVPGIWRELKNFSSGAICLVLTSHKYNEKDYIRNYDEFNIYKRT